ncbi:type IV pilin-like G/H family protein [Lyngbya sp. CCY1209]|uniref:type IV pilin-like G/H family protein n=1 Tax=Lyngbya sp. CCY1209 TaxID=2886103 RepID=UPI002D20F099|nr:type IV pilin-like G/H family protein [Lyngbya sp. CCY1209]MEB3883631.1 type IV pilin-like G/H family protein [Lyngbya sp. CCY1209]
MKTELKAKFLQHISQKKREGGFTLIELLVVIIIIGILSAIALPSFLNQANKAKQSEAKQYLASINKGQQAYFVENSDFATGIEELGLGIATATQNYTYGLAASSAGSAANTTAVASGLRGYGGLVFLVDAGDSQTSQSIICESTSADQVAGFTAGNSLCGANFEAL